MFTILGFLRSLFHSLPVNPAQASSIPRVAPDALQSTEGALMEEAEACAGSDLRHAQELRRAAITLLGVSR